VAELSKHKWLQLALLSAQGFVAMKGRETGWYYDVVHQIFYQANWCCIMEPTFHFHSIINYYFVS